MQRKAGKEHIVKKCSSWCSCRPNIVEKKIYLNEIKMNISIFNISYLGYWYEMFFNNCYLFLVQITIMLSHYLVVDYDNKQHLISVELDYYYYYQQRDFYDYYFFLTKAHFHNTASSFLRVHS